MSSAGTPKRTLDSEDEELPTRLKRSRRGASPHDNKVLPNGYRNDLSSFSHGGGSSDDERPHQPGAIRRVKLKDFVTYSSVEFFPGPSLNMVIGPNGTGKSTLVCAICIGLGYDPKFLGRAKDVSEFVKHGADEAFIEIELERQAGTKGPHPVVRCNIKRDGNKAMYSINKRPFSAKLVKQAMGRYGVQIDNLCQFLPQDRVVEFAGMTPVELLKSTQRAVASQQMIDWHEQLKVLRKSQRDLQIVKKAQDEELASLEAQHRRQEADVQRIQERQDVRKHVAKLKGIRQLVGYDEKSRLVKESRTRLNVMATELKELQTSVEPALREANLKNEYKQAIMEALDDRKQHMHHLFEGLQARELATKDIENKLDRHKDRTEKHRADIKTAGNQVNQAKKEVRELNSRVAQPCPVSEDQLNEIFEKIKRLSREDRETGTAYEQLQDERNGLERQMRERDGRIRQQEARLKELNSKAGQQNEKLARINRDTARAWNWIQRNQNLFEKPVFGPPMLQCSVKDPRDVDMVESLIPPAEMLMISTQTKGDFVLLQQKLREQGLSRVNQRHVTVGLERFQPPVRQEELQRYGIEGWVIDRLDGPEVCLASLCEGARIHSTGFASREMTEREFQNASSSNMNQWVTPGGSFRITRRREYGPDAVSTTTRSITKARHWSDEPIDTSVTQEIQRTIAELNDESKELEIQIREIDGNRKKSLANRRSELRIELDGARKEQSQFQRASREYEALPIKLEQAKSKLEERQDESKKVTEGLQDVERQHDDYLIQKSDAALQYADAVEAIRLALDERQEAEIMLIEATSDCEVLAVRNHEITAELNRKTKEHEAAQLAWQTLRNEVSKLRDKVKAEAQALSNEVKAFFGEVREQMHSLVILDAEIESQQARLSLLQGDDGGRTLRMYEERAAKIESLKTKTSDSATALVEVSEKVTSIRRSWEPRLEKLVARISRSFEYNMQQINCAGEVDIFKDEDDFDRWAVQIRVKFRENEPLSQLDSHRQSGGERAVSTIFYLMSLQALTRSPFRVVDEINQGMDPRNERLVHARMVSIATGRDEMPVEQMDIPIHRRDDDDDDEDDDSERAEEDSNSEDGDEGDRRVNGSTQRKRRTNGEAATNGDDNEDGDDGDDGDDDNDGPSPQGTQRSGSQYFLITPKLLPDLRYEAGMRVLCIGSGEHMPDAGRAIVDFEKALAVRGGGGPMASAAA